MTLRLTIGDIRAGAIRAERSIVRGAWTRHATYRTRYLACAESPAFAHLRFVRLESRAQARPWIATATRAG